jgi:hypothetical protein
MVFMASSSKPTIFPSRHGTEVCGELFVAALIFYLLAWGSMILGSVTMALNILKKKWVSYGLS